MLLLASFHIPTGTKDIWALTTIKLTELQMLEGKFLPLLGQDSRSLKERSSDSAYGFVLGACWRYTPQMHLPACGCIDMQSGLVRYNRSANLSLCTRYSKRFPLLTENFCIVHPVSKQLCSDGFQQTGCSSCSFLLCVMLKTCELTNDEPMRTVNA